MPQNRVSSLRLNSHNQWQYLPGVQANSGSMSRKQRSWFSDGLRFECTQCGACCTGTPGLVQFTTQEGEAMAEQLKLSSQEFFERHAMSGDEEGLWEMGEVQTEHGFDCVLLERCESSGKTWCTAHDSRPLQCRTWPFWPDNLRNKKSWNKAAKECEGIGRGDIVPLRVIQDDMQRTPEWGQSR